MAKSEVDVKCFVFLVHRIYIDKLVKHGGADYIAEYLTSRGYTRLSIENPLTGGGVTIVTKGEEQRRLALWGSGALRWAQETLVNIYIVLKEARNSKLILAVDPLNYISAYVLRLLTGAKIHFHSIDYSEERFDTKALNWLYDILHTFSVRTADVVTYVSKPMGQKILEKAPNFGTRVLFYLPNSPEFEKLPRILPSRKNKLDIAYTKSVISDTEIGLLTKVVSLVRKRYPNIRLHLIGSVSAGAIGSATKEGLSSNFVFHGLVPYMENIAIVSRCYIGIAWYENLLSFEKYADSLKLREYAALGIPALCNSNIATASEMRDFGAGVIADTVESLSDSLTGLLSDSAKYIATRERALEWARCMDKQRLLAQLYFETKLDV